MGLLVLFGYPVAQEADAERAARAALAIERARPMSRLGTSCGLIYAK